MDPGVRTWCRTCDPRHSTRQRPEAEVTRGRNEWTTGTALPPDRRGRTDLQTGVTTRVLSRDVRTPRECPQKTHRTHPGPVRRPVVWELGRGRLDRVGTRGPFPTLSDLKSGPSPRPRRQSRDDKGHVASTRWTKKEEVLESVGDNGFHRRGDTPGPVPASHLSYG